MYSSGDKTSRHFGLNRCMRPYAILACEYSRVALRHNIEIESITMAYSSHRATQSISTRTPQPSSQATVVRAGGFTGKNSR